MERSILWRTMKVWRKIVFGKLKEGSCPLAKTKQSPSFRWQLPRSCSLIKRVPWCRYRRHLFEAVLWVDKIENFCLQNGWPARNRQKTAKISMKGLSYLFWWSWGAFCGTFVNEWCWFVRNLLHDQRGRQWLILLQLGEEWDAEVGFFYVSSEWWSAETRQNVWCLLKTVIQTFPHLITPKSVICTLPVCYSHQRPSTTKLDSVTLHGCMCAMMCSCSKLEGYRWSSENQSVSSPQGMQRRNARAKRSRE